MFHVRSELSQSAGLIDQVRHVPKLRFLEATTGDQDKQNHYQLFHDIPFCKKSPWRLVDGLGATDGEGKWKKYLP
jgi:hypothetical protein